MQHTTALIIGAGQNGLAMSREFSRLSIDHMILEEGRTGESWRTQRWDSLRLLTPNWMNALSGETYTGPEPEGFMTARQLVESFDAWKHKNRPPLHENVKVLSLKRLGDGYVAETDMGPIAAQIVVVATGAYARTRVPAFDKELPPAIAQYTALDYKGPGDLPYGGTLVVGASSSGLQIARELSASGRRIVLAVGSHLRLPRTYRGADIVTWMDRAGVLDEHPQEGDDFERKRHLPSLPLIGTPERSDLDLNVLQDMGVEIAGRLAGIVDGRAQFSGSLANVTMAADLKMGRLLDRIDQWIADNGVAAKGTPVRPAPTRIPDEPRLGMDLMACGIRSVVWATGMKPDHDFIEMPVFDAKGDIMHHEGMVEPGLAVMGLPYMRTARSMSISGAQSDAHFLAQKLVGSLAQPVAA